MSMIERVAKALAESDPKYRHVPFEHMPKANKRAFMSDARSAIIAMREPTEDVLAAGIAEGGKAYEYTGDTLVCHPSLSWRAMIDAALAG